MPYQVFEDTYSLKKIELPAELEEIKGSAFGGSGLTSIEIPDYVKSIEFSFSRCDQLKDIKISGCLANTMTMIELNRMFDIEYKQEGFKSFKLTIDSEPNYDHLSEDFANYGFSENPTKKKRAKYASVNLHQWFRETGLLNKQNQISEHSDFEQFVQVMKKSIQDTGYNKGEECFHQWLDDMTDMDYDYTYHNSFFMLHFVNVSAAALQTYSFLEQKGAVIYKYICKCIYRVSCV